MENTSGIEPTWIRVIVVPDEAKKKIGSFERSQEYIMKDEAQQMIGTIVSVGANAFDRFKEPVPKIGEKVWFKMAVGAEVIGKDDVKYRVINGVDILGIYSKEVTSGIIPIWTWALVLADKPREKTEGGIFLPSMTKEKEDMIQSKGTFLSAGGNAFDMFSGLIPEEGDRVCISKYVGLRIKGNDGVEYRLIHAREIFAIIMEEKEIKKEDIVPLTVNQVVGINA